LEEEYTEITQKKRQAVQESQRIAKKQRTSTTSSSRNSRDLKKSNSHSTLDFEESLGPNPIIINTRQCQLAMKELSSEKVIAVDLEWAGEGRQATLSLLQIATDKKV
jgi:hypothetical protein